MASEQDGKDSALPAFPISKSMFPADSWFFSQGRPGQHCKLLFPPMGMERLPTTAGGSATLLRTASLKVARSLFWRMRVSNGRPEKQSSAMSVMALSFRLIFFNSGAVFNSAQSEAEREVRLLPLRLTILQVVEGRSTAVRPR